MADWNASNSSSLQERVTGCCDAYEECLGVQRPPPKPACDRCRLSSAIVFGDWEPLELESILNISGCACLPDVSATIQLVSKPDLEHGYDLTCCGEVLDSTSDSDAHSPQYRLPYHDWITRRIPVKLPPGLPRPPRQSATAAPCVVTDDDLANDCDDWYNRNVANGNFPDWMHEEQRAAAAISPPPPFHACASICSGEDLEAECDERFSLNLAAEIFLSSLGTDNESGASGTAPDAASQQDLRAAICQQHAAAQDAPAGYSSAGAIVPEPAHGSLASSPYPSATHISDQSNGSSSSPAPLNTHGAVGCPAATPGLNPLPQLSPIAVTAGADSDEGGCWCESVPPSPAISDSGCRTTVTSEGCYSHGSSRSCSCLSLGSMDTMSSDDSSSCEVWEAEDVACTEPEYGEERKEGDEAQGGMDVLSLNNPDPAADSQCPGCSGPGPLTCSSVPLLLLPPSSSPSSSPPRVHQHQGQGCGSCECALVLQVEEVLVQSVDCTAWELEVEVQLGLSSAVTVSHGGGSGCLGQSGLRWGPGWHGGEAGAMAWACNERPGLYEEGEERGAELRCEWVERQLGYLLNVVVAEALFGEDGGEEELEEGVGRWYLLRG